MINLKSLFIVSSQAKCKSSAGNSCRRSLQPIFLQRKCNFLFLRITQSS